MYKITPLIFLCSYLSFSQVGINTTEPDPSSMFEIHATDKGLLIPRVSLNNVLDQTTIEAPARSLLVFNNGNENMVRGFYFWGGLKWHYLNDDVKPAWLLEGNTIEDPEYAVGTNNSMSLKLKTNNKIVADFDPAGGFVIGMNATADPSNAIAIGRSARAVEPQNIAIGMGSTATGDVSFAIGAYAKGMGDFSTAVGTDAQGRGYNATSIGHMSSAMSAESLAIGGGAAAIGKSAVAIGSYAEASSIRSFALGVDSKATAENSFAIGYKAKAEYPHTIILGEVQDELTLNQIPIKVGIGTINPQAKLDVDGDIKLGKKGSVLKGVSAFAITGITEVIPARQTHPVLFSIPEDLQPETTQAILNYTLIGAPDNLSIIWARLEGNTDIKVKFLNESESPINLSEMSINFSITEF